MSAVSRIAGLDLTRGLCAILVCIYHMLAWTGGPRLYTVGTYCVYVFFVVSGASLYLGYAGRCATGAEIRRFYARRYMRLAPLYVAVIVLGLLIGAVFSAPRPEVWKILANASLLFGLTGAGSTSIVTGGWSIGIEVIFYLLFPLLLPLMRTRFALPAALAALAVQHLYVNHVLGPAASLNQAHSAYTQPPSFIFYFVAGMLLGKLLSGAARPAAFKPFYWLPMLAGLAAIALWNTPDARAALIGPAGLLLSLIALAVAASGALIRLQGMALKLAVFLGNTSYGVYLLHPLIYRICRRLFDGLAHHPWGFAALVLALSLPCAYYMDRKFEAPLRAWLGRTAFKQRLGGGQAA